MIVDVREADEFASKHVNGAINVPLSLIISGQGLVDGVSKDDHIIVYCNSGNRSGVARQMLEAKGYTNVINGINQQTVEHKYLKT